MAIPESYKQYLTPAQLQQIQIMEAQQVGQPQLTFEQWLAQNPQYGQAASTGAKNPNNEAAKSLAKDFAQSAIQDYLTSSSTSGLASTAAENAAWNAAAMESTGAPMTLAESSSAQAAGTPAGLYIAPALATAYTAQKANEAYNEGKSKSTKDSILDPMKKWGTWLVGGMIGGQLVGGAGGLGGIIGESTRDTTKRHTKQLLKQSEDPGYQAYVQGMREQFNSGPPDPSKPFAGKYGSWGEYEKAGLQADNLTGVMGNIESFGPNWSKLNFDQQKAVTQALIDAKQYESKKGEVLVKDQNKAREIYDAVSKNGFKIPVAPAPTPAPAQLTKPAVQAVTTPIPVKRITFPTRGYSATGILGGR